MLLLALTAVPALAGLSAVSDRIGPGRATGSGVGAGLIWTLGVSALMVLVCGVSTAALLATCGENACAEGSLTFRALLTAQLLFALAPAAAALALPLFLAMAAAVWGIRRVQRS